MTDVVIIGAGLAGLNAARVILENSDFRVKLIDRGRSPKNNPLRLTFAKTVKKYDLVNCIRAEYSLFGIMSYHGAKSIHHFSDNPFVALDYQESCTNHRTTSKSFICRERTY